MIRPLPFRIIERLAAGSLRLWLIVGILLRVTRIRDSWRIFAFVFYTTPWPVIAFGLFVLALHARRLGHAHHTRRYLLLTGGALFTWVALSWHSAPSPQTGASTQAQLRLVAWNIARPQWRAERIVDWLRSQQADIYAIAESHPSKFNRPEDWEARFPGYQAVSLRGEMLCMARGKLSLVHDGALGVSSHYSLLHLDVGGAAYSILQADITPNIPRLKPLERLAAIAREHASERLIVVGDFNTPRESVGFDSFRQFLTHSFEASGTGFAETWPSFAPALSIDHVWSSRALRPLKCEISWTPWSDHRPLIVDLAADAD